MDTDYRLDLDAAEQHVVATITGSDPIEGDFAELLDSIFANAAAVVNAQGFSDGRQASMTVSPAESVAGGRSRRYAIDMRAGHPSIWRAITGRLAVYNTMSMPLPSVSFVDSSKRAKKHPSNEILRQQYPAARPIEGFELEREVSSGHDASAEIQLRPRVKKAVVEQMTATLNSWLELATGGFFKDGGDPMNSVHDCPAFEVVGGGLLVARFDYFLASQSAFDVMLNVVDHLHRQTGSVASVRMY